LDDLKKRTAFVLDSGMYFGLAERLARDFRKVFYYTPWENWVPFTRECAPGLGFEDKGIYRENYPLHLLDTDSEPDLWVFPHLAEIDLQYHLRKLGKRVWGSGEGHILEDDRWLLKECLQDAGLNVIQSYKIKGMEATRKFLEDHQDTFVKVSTFRGDMESMPAKGWLHEYDRLRLQFAALAEQMEFVVEDEIPDAIETGTDNLMIHGIPLFPMTIGYEIKDAAYFAKVVHLSDGLPEMLYAPLRAMAEFLKDKDYSNFFSTEMRITKDGQCFLNDATCRMPSPVGEIHLELWKNISQLMYEDAGGEAKVIPDPTAKYAVELFMKSKYAKKDWLAVDYPEKVANRVKLFLPCRIDGTIYAIPDKDHESEDFAAVVGLGNTLQEAEDDVRRIADMVKAPGVYYDDSVFDKAKEQIEEGEKLGIKF
jgi:hypothetical protein